LSVGHVGSVAAFGEVAHRSVGASGFDFGRWSDCRPARTLGLVSYESYELCGRRLWLITAVVGVFVAAVVIGDYSTGTRGGLLVLEVVVGAVGVALFPVLFRRPLPVGLVLIALAAFAATGTPLANAATIHIARTRPLPVAIGVAAAGVGTHALRGLWQPTSGLSYDWWLTLMIVLHAGLVGWGALAGARAAVITSLRGRAERAEAEQARRVAEARAAERNAIAREMHDVLAHRLSLLATYAGALEYRPDQPPERLSQAAGVIRTTVHQALNELRDVIVLLRDDPADDQGGDDGQGGDRGDDLARPVPALSDLPALVEESRAIGTSVELRDSVGAVEVPGTTGRTAFRVVQEALTNARKHAPGQPVRIALGGAPGSRLRIDVSNPLGDASAIPGSGTGLVGLTERVRLAGGQLDHRATATEFQLSASLPWPA
jgi:signal transduction histidine kinase